MHLPKERANYVFNHDASDMVSLLADTDMTEQDAADLLVGRLAKTQVNVIDWCISHSAEHNTRLAHGSLLAGHNVGHDKYRSLVRIVRHYASQPLDLMDIVIKHGHEAGMRVFGNIRLNYCGQNQEAFKAAPGRSVMSATRWGNKVLRKDFRDEAFHKYLADLFSDMLEKGVDGLGLDFERKDPFFPEEVSQEERYAATLSFLRCVRKLTDKPLMARVTYDEHDGARNGQDPEAWLQEGLLDVVVPATHNHNPDTLHWPFERFVKAAQQSPRPCQVIPQIWPVPTAWKDRLGNLHSHEAILQRVESFLAGGANGAYFFNFCCHGDLAQRDTLHLSMREKTFQELSIALTANVES